MPSAPLQPLQMPFFESQITGINTQLSQLTDATTTGFTNLTSLVQQDGWPTKPKPQSQVVSPWSGVCAAILLVMLLAQLATLAVLFEIADKMRLLVWMWG